MEKQSLAAVIIGLTLWGCGTAKGQNPFPGRNAVPYRAPAWSPYLNLFRPGNSAAFNYFSLVKPELEWRKGFQLQHQFNQQQQVVNQQVQQQIGVNQQTITGTLLPPTGHPVGFMTHRRYFMNLGSGASPTGAGIRAPTASSRFNQSATARPSSSSVSSASRFATPSTGGR